jgi:hypothetical protein
LHAQILFEYLFEIKAGFSTKQEDLEHDPALDSLLKPRRPQPGSRLAAGHP